MSNFTINRLALAKELSLLQSAAERKVTIPVLATVLMEFEGERLRLTVTDCSVTMQSEIEAQGEPWGGCVPLRQLLALARLLEGEAVTIAPRANGRVEVKYGENRHVLVGYAASEFIVTEKVEGATEIGVPGNALREGLKRVLPCVTQEESRYSIQGVCFEAGGRLLRLIATDSHRLGVAEIPIEGEGELRVLVPPAGVAALLKLDGDVTLRTNDKSAQFVCGSRTLITRLLAGKFPNWEMIMPAERPHSLKFDSAAMQAALRRVAVTREETYKTGIGVILGGVGLDFHADRVRVSTNINNKGESEEWVAAKSNLNGEAIAMGIDPDYLSDYLAHVDGEATCQLKDSHSALLFTESNFRYVLMGRRL